MSEYLRRHQLELMALPVALAATILYWPSLKLPLIYDSLLHIRIAKSLNLATVWLPTDKFGFYRPLTFFPMLVIRGLFGYYPAWLLQGPQRRAARRAFLAALAPVGLGAGGRAFAGALSLCLPGHCRVRAQRPPHHGRAHAIGAA